MAVSTEELDLAPYAGRWIAIVRGQVAGVGLSLEEARRLAKHNRPREEPVVVFVSAEEGLACPLNMAPLTPTKENSEIADG